MAVDGNGSVDGVRLEGFDRYALMVNGRSVHLRAACSTDRSAVRAFYDRLGDTSTYYRFFGLRRAIPESEMEALVAPRLPSAATLLATIGDEIVGVGEFHVGSDPHEAEVAFAVSDDQQGHGIGTLLLEDLAVIAEQIGVRRFVAQTLPGNDAMQLVFRTAGLAQQQRFDDGVMDIVLDLTDHRGLRREAAEREATAVAASLAPFFHPRHLVIFGEAMPGTAVARRVAEVTAALGSCQVSIIDPGTADGRHRVARLCELDTVPDLAVIAGVPEETANSLLQCSAAGVPAAVVVSSDHGALSRWFGPVSATAHRLGMRILGPLAELAVPACGLLATHDTRPLRKGHIAVVDLDARRHILERTLVQRDLGVSAFVAIGPSSDVAVEDLLLHWFCDVGTRVVLIDPPIEITRHRQRRIVTMVAESMPIVMVAADDEVGRDPGVDCDGVVRVRNREALLDVGAFFAAAPAGVGPRVACIARSQECDADLQPALRTAGLSPARISAATADRVRDLVSVVAGRADGLVVVADHAEWNDSVADEVIAALLTSGEVDGCLAVVDGGIVIATPGAVGAIARLALAEAGWERGLAVLGAVAGWSAHQRTSDGFADLDANDLYQDADGVAEPLR